MAAEGIAALGPDGGEHLPRGDRHHRILAEAPQLEAVELRFGPDFVGVNLHQHDDHTDAFYVLSGEAEFQLGEEVVRVGPGSFIAVPPGVTHGFRVAGESELRLLNIHAPNVGFAAQLRADSL